MERTASRPIELAFYGGTFTALPERLQMEYLALAMQAKEKGIVCRVRCSTRPDALRPDRLQALRHAGLDLVELGIQSFHTEALLDVQRGYNGDRAREGCRLIKESGLKLGIQLLPGMPGSTPQRFSEDVEEALAFSPSCLRFYPCLVVDGTPLAERWRMGQYAPWELDTTITTLGKALASAWARRIPVIRLSLAPERELDESVLAGPRHPLALLRFGLFFFRLAAQHAVGSACRRPYETILRNAFAVFCLRKFPLRTGQPSCYVDSAFRYLSNRDVPGARSSRFTFSLLDIT